MKAKKFYKTPSLKVIQIDPRDILATSDTELRLSSEREEEGYGG